MSQYNSMDQISMKTWSTLVCTTSSQILRNRETWFENGEIKRMRFELACKIIESAASQGKTIDMPTFQLFPTPAEDRAEKSKWRENIDPDTSYSEYIEHIKRTQTDITLRRTYNF